MVDKELLQAIGKLLEPINNRLGNLETKVDNLGKNVTSIGLTLENETNKDIRIIAEGHLDLSRKLDEELLLLRVNHLENELRKAKERLDELERIA